MTSSRLFGDERRVRRRRTSTQTTGRLGAGLGAGATIAGRPWLPHSGRPGCTWAGFRAGLLAFWGGAIPKVRGSLGALAIVHGHSFYAAVQLTAGGKTRTVLIMRYSTPAAILALIAGCAQLEWLKPDKDSATRDEDLARCEQQARLTASRMSPSARALTPSVVVSPSGSASVQMPPPYAPSDPTLEMDFLTSCMHAKGYRLVPAKSAGGH